MQRPDHGVERVGDADHEGVRRVFFDAGADLLHHLEVDFEKIVAAHAGLARNARGHDDDIGILDVDIVVRALEIAVEAFDRRGFGNVERFALRHAFEDIEDHDVAEFLEADQMGQRPADHASADKRNLLARHENRSFEVVTLIFAFVSNAKAPGPQDDRCALAIICTAGAQAGAECVNGAAGAVYKVVDACLKALIQECLLEGGRIELRRPQRSGVAFARTAAVAGARTQERARSLLTMERGRHLGSGRQGPCPGDGRHLPPQPGFDDAPQALFGFF